MPFDKAKPFCTLPWEDDWVTAVAFVGASRKVVAGNKLGPILLWDLPAAVDAKAPPAPVLRLDHHANYVTHLASTPDGKVVVSASYDHTVAFWDVAAAPVGKAKVVLDAEGRAKNAKRTKKVEPVPEAEVGLLAPVKVFREHGEWVQAMSLSRDGELLATGDDAGEVIVRRVPSGEVVNRWKTTGWVSALAFAPDKKTLVVAERIPRDGERFRALAVWDVAAGKRALDLMPAMAKKEMEFASADVSPDGKLIAVGQGDDETSEAARAFLVNAADGKRAGETKGTHLNGLRCVRFSRDGAHLLTCGRDTTVRVWKVPDGSAVKELGSPRGGQFKDWLCALAVSADGGLVAAADMAGAVQVWDVG